MLTKQDLDAIHARLTGTDALRDDRDRLAGRLAECHCLLAALARWPAAGTDIVTLALAARSLLSRQGHPWAVKEVNPDG